MDCDFEVTIDIAAPPARVWELIGDPASVPRWYPLYTSCEVEGDARTLRRADGTVIVERLLERDEGRSYAYSVLSGLPLSDHRASFEVRPSPAGSVLAWRTRARPDDPGVDLEARLVPRQLETLERIRDLIEGS